MTIPPKSAFIDANHADKDFLGHKLPKLLHEYNGKPLIDHLLDKLMAVGVRTVVLHAPHKPKMIASHLKSYKGIVDIVMTEESWIAEKDREAPSFCTGHYLDILGDGAFYFMRANSLWFDSDNSLLGHLKNTWNSADVDWHCAFYPRARSKIKTQCYRFFIDQWGYTRVGDRYEISPYTCMGVGILHARAFQYTMPQGSKLTFFRVSEMATIKRRAKGFVYHGHWQPIQTLDDLEKTTFY
jgi:MurNAc alpha-1-phosphate uridylyltransferase